jgi:Holliday junction DNA helicase RuvA
MLDRGLITQYSNRDQRGEVQMIGHLRGQLLYKKPNQVLVEVQGVGYEVYIPLTSFYELPDEGGEVILKIHTHVREDMLALYGFKTQREKDFFLKLISISGIGPKLGISILSGAPVEELAHAISEGDLSRLTAIPGVGRKTAERVVLELKAQISSFLAPERIQGVREHEKLDNLQEDIISALVNLGYPRAAAEKALLAAIRSGDCERSFEDLLSSSLRRLAG